MKIIGYAPTFRDWDGLIGACQLNLDLLQDVQPLLDELASLLDRAKALKLEQEDLEGRRMELTQTLVQTVESGLEVARSIRTLIKFRLGARSERLAQFGIAPLRTRTRKRKLEPKPPTFPAPETAAPEATASSPPKTEGKAPPATTMDANPK